MDSYVRLPLGDNIKIIKHMGISFISQQKMKVYIRATISTPAVPYYLLLLPA